MAKKMLLFSIALILIQGCSSVSKPTPQSTVSGETPYTLVNTDFVCEPVLHLSIGEGEEEFTPYVEPVPTFITFDLEGNLYLDDQVNSRLFRYSDFDLPPEIIQIPLHRAENVGAYFQYWLGIVVTTDRIYIMHNPELTPNHHLLISVLNMDGTEITLLDINTYSEIPAYEGDAIEQNWRMISMDSDGHGGIFIYLPIEGYFAHINRRYQMTILRTDELGLDPYGYLVSGWNGLMYSHEHETHRIVLMHYGTGQNIDWMNFNDTLSRNGFEQSFIYGADIDGNVLFSGSNGAGLYENQSGDILLTSRLFSNSIDPSIQEMDNEFSMSPDGAIYRFDSTNWPESRELLRCEFVPLP